MNLFNDQARIVIALLGNFYLSIVLPLWIIILILVFTEHYKKIFISQEDCKRNLELRKIKQSGNGIMKLVEDRGKMVNILKLMLRKIVSFIFYLLNQLNMMFTRKFCTVNKIYFSRNKIILYNCCSISFIINVCRFFYNKRTSEYYFLTSLFGSLKSLQQSENAMLIKTRYRT